ncbi:MAG: hypothetical protein EXR72_18610 [Myxococcales bacterium]|nr:hypothetical protein [Myxococcales bacterium]
MENLIAGGLRIDVVLEPGLAVLAWTGKSNDRNPSKILGPYLAAVIDDAAKRALAVEMHFERLDHVNSSTIAAIIQLLQEARRRGVRLVLVYDPSLRWQRMSFDALRVFEQADDLLRLRAT